VSLFDGPKRGPAGFVQELLLRVAFAMQDCGDLGRRFENWVCPPGYLRPAKEPIDEFWKLP
jgi:hypothetical protein